MMLCECTPRVVVFHAQWRLQSRPEGLTGNKAKL